MTPRLAELLVLSLLALALSSPTGVRAGQVPDISGVWLGLTGTTYQPAFEPLEGGPAPLKPAALAQYQRRIAAYERGEPLPDTASQCLPHGVPRSMLTPYPMHILQTPGLVTIVHESGHNVRLIYLDAVHPPGLRATFMGHSVGHWERETLVVDTVGIDWRTWLDEAGKPHGPRLHVIERLRRLPGGALEDRITIDDPDTFTRPWTTMRVYQSRPDLRLLEYICEENDRDIEREAGEAR
jgi:hypothetical protein